MGDRLKGRPPGDESRRDGVRVWLADWSRACVVSGRRPAADERSTCCCRWCLDCGGAVRQRRMRHSALCRAVARSCGVDVARPAGLLPLASGRDPSPRCATAARAAARGALAA
jgi:hypothetical protein